ncbi:hypothetical protein F5888DRAFT_1619668 [Russula emetica]|nr:hypothetical protein F5888DRAFT_1619668 [Russula emetica]
MSLRARIDNAFYSALDPQNRPSHDPVEAPGGFLLDDNPGGFLPPSPPAAAGHETRHEPERDDQFSYIPLSRIPHALQLLDLPPDDEEVLTVFRNAATGWEDDRDPTTTSEDNDVTEGRVSLRDWRAVCAAVMGEDGDDEDDREGSSAVNGDEILDATGEDSPPELEESSGGSSDEYRITETRSRKRSRKSAAATGGGAGAGATRRTRARKTQSATMRRRSPLSPSTSAEITPRQQRECLKAFMLFFPGVPEEEAQRRRLGVREVNAAATVLKEKIKSEEIIEMLEAFSTSPDKTMSLSDFEKMMMTTRLA